MVGSMMSRRRGDLSLVGFRRWRMGGRGRGSGSRMGGRGSCCRRRSCDGFASSCCCSSSSSRLPRRESERSMRSIGRWCCSRRRRGSCCCCRRVRVGSWFGSMRPRSPCLPSSIRFRVRLSSRRDGRHVGEVVRPSFRLVGRNVVVGVEAMEVVGGGREEDAAWEEEGEERWREKKGRTRWLVRARERRVGR